MTHRPYTPPAWQSKPLADGRVTLLVVPLSQDINERPDDWTLHSVCPLHYMARPSAKGKFGATFESRSIEPGTLFICPQVLPYAPGDLIWCRETWAAWDGCPPAVFKATDDVDPYGGWKSPITMPKWAARTWLCCTGVEVRRVQTISEGEAWAVGCPKGDPTDNGGWFPKEELQPDGSEMGWDCPEDWVADKWDEQYALKPRKRAGGTLPPKPAVDLSFDANPWAAFTTVEKISKEDV